MIQTVAQVIAEQPRAEVLEQDANYLHAEFTTALLKFKDDVEFRFSAEDGQLFARSASRVGRSDFGANRKRLKLLQQLLQMRGVIL